MNTKKIVSTVIGLVIFGFVFVLPKVYKQGPWKEYTAPENGFSIMFPGDPVIKADSKQTGLVTQKNTQYDVNPLWGRIGAKFSVIITDISGPNLTWDDQAALEGGKEGLRSEGFTLKSEKEISISGLQGWEFEATSDTTDSTLRMVRKDFRLYVLEVARKKGENHAEEIQRFMDSFKIM